MSDPSLPYADYHTTARQKRESLDRAMTLRLAFTVGIALAIFGALPFLLTLWTASRLPITNFGWAVAWGLLGAYLLPAIGMLTARRAVFAGQRGGAVAVLIACSWTLLVLLLSFIGSIILIVMGAIIDQAIAGSVIDVLMSVAVGKLLFHSIRLLVFDGLRGGGAEQAVDIREIFSSNWLADPYRRVQACKLLGISSVMQGGVLGVLGVAIAVMAATPSRPATTNLGTAPVTAATHPFNNAFLNPDGLSKTDCDVFIQAVDPNGELTAEHRKTLMDICSQFGAMFLPVNHQPLTVGLVRSELSRFLQSDRPPINMMVDLGGNRVEWGMFAGTPTQFSIYHDMRLPERDGNQLVTSFGGGMYGTLDVNYARWVAGTATELVEAAARQTSGQLTQEQAETIWREVTSIHVKNPPSGFPPTPMPPALTIDAAMRSDGVLKVTLGQSTFWITPSGETSDVSPEQVAAQGRVQFLAAQAALDQNRLVKISPMWGAFLALAAAGCAACGLKLWIDREYFAGPNPPAEWLKRLCVCSVICGGLLVLIFSSLYQHAHWWTIRIGMSATGFLLLLLLVAWIILGGIVLPLRVRAATTQSAS